MIIYAVFKHTGFTLLFVTRSIVVVAVLMLLMMFAVHCTWVTSNAYSSPSIVLASYGNDGSRQVRYICTCLRMPLQSYLMIIWI